MFSAQYCVDKLNCERLKTNARAFTWHQPSSLFADEFAFGAVRLSALVFTSRHLKHCSGRMGRRLRWGGEEWSVGRWEKEAWVADMTALHVPPHLPCSALLLLSQPILPPEMDLLGRISIALFILRQTSIFHG